MVRAFAFLGFASMCVAGMGQVNDLAIRQEVLERGVFDSTFVFGEWSENGGTETHLTLLGQVTDARGRCLKVMTSVWIWGLGMRATNRILIFSGTNRFLGQYDATMIDDLPDRLGKGGMVFEPQRDDHCDVRDTEYVDLTRGLPKKFFLNCKGEYVFY